MKIVSQLMTGGLYATVAFGVINAGMNLSTLSWM